MRDAIHRVSKKEIGWHCLAGGANCYCEPEIQDFGNDSDGKPIRLFNHQELSKRIKANGLLHKSHREDNHKKRLK